MHLRSPENSPQLKIFDFDERIYTGLAEKCECSHDLRIALTKKSNVVG